MKDIIKIIAMLTLVASLALIFFGFLPTEARSTSGEAITYLVAGFDDAAENTDVLCLLSYNGSGGHVRVIQIPRDTYYFFGKGQNKINQLYAHLRHGGKTPAYAMEKLRSALSGVLGIEIDGYVGIPTGAFKSLIGSLGGVKITVDEPETFSGLGINLVRGENRLSAEDALKFVRYRQGYATGDLGRLDAQKLFFRGLFNCLKETKFSDIVLAFIKARGIVSDITLPDIIKIFGKSPDFSSLTLSSVTLGGAPTLMGGVSYFVVNKPACVALLGKTYNLNEDNFDRERLFIKMGASEFENIYYSRDIGYKEFYDEPINIK